LNVLLKPLELIWRGVNRARRRLYQSGRLRSKTLPRPVISIGNLSVGGSGKTPATIAVVSILQRQGMKVAVLTRGYRRESDQWMIADGTDPARSGDEPALLARKLPGAGVVVGADRHSAGTRYLQDRQCDVFVLDDGFQHLRLHRDLDIVIDDSNAKWLREGPGALHSADIVLVRGGEATPGAFPPRFSARLQPAGWLLEGSTLPTEALRGRKAHAFAGLANNDQFFAMVRSLGIEIASTRSFGDHHSYSAADLSSLRSSGELLITTEKDLVKISDGAGIAALVVEMRIEPRAEFESLLLQEVEAAGRGAGA
jgi:tetraacyldisaccharide 4'-kinase